MKRSPEQLAAINTVGKNIILSASAGAGKTTVLIARLIKGNFAGFVYFD